MQTGWRSLTLRGAFQGETWYTLKLRPGFESSERFGLAGSNTFTLRMPRIAPRLYFPALSRDQLAGGNRSFPLLAVNVPQVRAAGQAAGPPNSHPRAAGLRELFCQLRMKDGKAATGTSPIERWTTTWFPGGPSLTSSLPWMLSRTRRSSSTSRGTGCWPGRKTGVVFLDAERVRGESERAPALGTQALIQLTDLGLVWKQARTGVEVFVFSHSTGQPVPGATARLFSDENEPLREAITDAKGLAHLEANTNADWVAVQKGDDFHAAVLKENRVWLYRFDLPFDGVG